VIRAAKKGLTAFLITQDCVGCGLCKQKCPWAAILGEKKKRHLIEPTLCRGCGTCWHSCPRCAVADPGGTRRKKGGRPRVLKARIDRQACVGCQNCLLNCEREAISHQDSMLSGTCQVDESRCIGCGSCLSFCAGECISLA
jgi:Pyruvate/2-oxoacid:ferredoxin oxidoreductase delta subunit